MATNNSTFHQYILHTPSNNNINYKNNNYVVIDCVSLFRRTLLSPCVLFCMREVLILACKVWSNLHCIYMTYSSTKTCRCNFLFAKQRRFLHKVFINSNIHFGVYRGGNREVQNFDRWRRVWLCLPGDSRWRSRSGSESPVSHINSGNSRIW